MGTRKGHCVLRSMFPLMLTLIEVATVECQISFLGSSALSFGPSNVLFHLEEWKVHSCCVSILFLC